MQRKILIVEDEALNRRLLNHILSSEYDVLEAENGQEALDILQRKHKVISAVLLDILMPLMDGFEVLKQMRMNAALSQIPVIVATGSQDRDTEVKALSLGANEYVTKPYNPTLILHSLRNTINLRETASIVNAIQRDKLTGLYNREAFFSKSADMIREHAPGYYVMACFDIDSFKVINDQYGAAEGDRILQHVGKVAKACFSQVGGISSRISADNFAALYPAGEKEIDYVTKMRDYEFSRPDTHAAIVFSVGRYIVTDLSLSASAIYDRAYLAKQSVKGRYDVHVAYFDESMRDKLLQEQQIISDMDAALALHQFQVWFQPQFNHSTGALIGAEALVRWQHPERGLIAPDQFIPVFEQNGFVYELDKYVWEQACRFLRKWLDSGRTPLPVSVNVSRYDIFREDFYSIITGLVDKYGIPADLLHLEITESAFAKSAKQIIAVVEKLMGSGFTVEIDDFGSGYSSLNTLKDVPATVLKLDMRFLESEGDSRRGGNILESVVRMAKWLDMSVIAEGVETQEQADYLRSIGCNYVQGFLYAKPMPAEEYEALALNTAQERRLPSLETVENLDNNAFWDPASMDTLIFNSYVGGACIFEYHKGSIELLRANEKYAQVIGSAGMTVEDALKLNWAEHLDQETRLAVKNALHQSIHSGDAVTGELVFRNLPGCPEETYLRSTMRVIASSGDHYLVYCTNENTTAQRQAERKEHETAQHLQAIMSNINGGVTAAVICRGVPRILFANEEFYRQLGFTKEQYQSQVRNPHDLIHPEDRKRVARLTRQASRQRKPFTVIYRIIRRDQSVRWLQSNISITDFANMKEPVQLAVANDITDLRITQEREQRTSEQLNIIMNNINGGVTVTAWVDGAPRILFANDQYYAQLGYTKEQYDAEAHPTLSMFYPEDRDRTLAQAEQIGLSRQPGIVIYRVVRRDGAIRWIQSNISMVDYPGVEGLVQLAVTNDITALREAEEKERRASEQVQAIMDDAGSGITATVAVDSQVRFLLANDQYYQILGYTRSQYEKEVSNVYDIIHPEDRQRVSEIATEAYREEKPAQMEYRIIRRDGVERYVRAILSPTRFSGVEQSVQLCIFTDVTVEKQAIQALYETDEQLRFLNETAHDLLAQPDSEKGLEEVLHKLLHYFDAARGYIFELDYAKKTASNTYEACAPGVTREKNNLQELSFDVCSFWLHAFDEKGFIDIQDVEALDDSRPEKEILRAQGIRSLIAVSLKRDGKLIGFIGIDDPSQQHNRVDRLVALGDYIAVMLTRRDLDAKIISDNKTLMGLMNDTPGGFVRMQVLPEGSIVPIYFNDGFCTLTGMNRAQLMELYGRDALSGVHPDDIPVVKDAVSRMMAQGQAYSSKYRLLHGNGEYIWLRIYGRMTQSESGQIYLNIYYTDISGQTHAEQQREELMENLPCGAGICEISQDGSVRAVYLNKRYRAYLRRTTGVQDSISAMEVIHPDDRKKLAQAMEPALAQGGEGSCDVRILDGKGEYIPMRVVGSALERIGDKNSIYVTFTPISKEEQSYNEMLPVALSAVIGASSDPSFVKDRNHCYVCCNRAFALAAGLADEKDVIGKTDDDLVDKKLADWYRAQEEELIANRQALLEYQEVMPTKDGTLKYATTSKYPLLDSSGSVIGIYSVTRDTTAAHKADSQLSLLTDSIPGGLATYACSPGQIKITYFNDGFCRLLGFTREEYAQLSASNPVSMVFQEDRPILEEQFGRLLQDNTPMECVYRAHVKGGGFKWISQEAVAADRHDDTVIVNAVLLDITQQQEVTERLRISEEEHRLALEHSGNIICRYIVADRTAILSPEAAQAVAMPERAEDVPYGPVREGWIYPDSVQAYVGFYESILRGESTGEAVFQQRANDGWRHLKARFSTIFSGAGDPVSAVISFEDVTEQLEKETVYKKWQQSLQQKDPESYTLFRSNLSRDASFDTMEGELLKIRFDPGIRTFNERTREYAEQCVCLEDREKYEALLNSDTLLANYYRGKRSQTLDYREKLPSGGVRWLRLSVDLVEYPNSSDVEAYMMYEDIDGDKRNELKTIERAETDPLTGVLNRVTFAARFEQLRRTGKPGAQYALLMLDVDGFKQVNDVFGHSAGDQALIDIAASIGVYCAGEIWSAGSAGTNS